MTSFYSAAVRTQGVATAAALMPRRGKQRAWLPLALRMPLPLSVRLALPLAVLVWLGGCAAPPPPPVTELIGMVQASANLNPSVSRRPSPLLIRVYELKSASAFSAADFVSLYQRDQAELGAEMVSREEFTLNPGDSRPLAKVAAAETRFLGVFAAYRDLDRASWRSVVAIVPGQKQRIVISAEELSISATVSN